jgi:rhodanese-related sulfurtransferase/rubrerythrin
MKWREFLTPVKSMDTEEAKSFIAGHGEGEYTLLDVRQPGEYEQKRIPGARLIPLPDLTDRIEELDSEKPLITYCAVGGRSRAAAQLLAGKGIKNVYNLKGGIKAWEGLTSEGPADMGMSALKGDATVDEIIVFAYGMEQGLGDFYRTLADKTDDRAVSGLFISLSKVEEKHKERLFNIYLRLDKTVSDREGFELKAADGVLEGGFTTQEFLEKNRHALDTIPDIINIAMMLEAQSLDLYMRYSQRIVDDKGKEVFFSLADEEKAHLASLGSLMEKKV